jgi:uncharacterized protein (DUF4213/DUF364 family)
MILDQKLFASVSAAAGRVMVDQVTIGLGYTAVTTSDGDIGIAATGVALDGSHAGNLNVVDYEGRPAIDLLEGILVPDPMLRTMALALINALNHNRTMQFPEDVQNRILFDRFGILGGARVAMVGYFPPLVRFLEKKQIPLSVIDNARGLGDKKTFHRQLDNWAEVLILTATSIVNRTMEDLLAHAGPQVETVILGPSTPILPDAFDHLRVDMLAGSAITDREGALKAVRHGGGTHALKPFSRKVYWCADDGKATR